MWLLPVCCHFLLQFLLVYLVLPLCLARKDQPKDRHKNNRRGKSTKPERGTRRWPSSSSTITTTSVSRTTSNEKTMAAAAARVSARSKMERHQPPPKSKLEPSKRKVELPKPKFESPKPGLGPIDLNLTETLERYDREFLRHSCWGGQVRRDRTLHTCTVCEDYETNMTSFHTTYHNVYGKRPDAVKGQKLMKEFCSRLHGMGYECREDKGLRVRWDCRPNRHFVSKKALRPAIDRFLKERDDERKREKKKEDEQAAGGGGGGGGQYEALFDEDGANRFTGQKKAKEPSKEKTKGQSNPEEHYESLFAEPLILTQETQSSREEGHDDAD